MEWLSELLVAAFIVVGATFALIGSYGMLRLPDLMRRLHAPTKASTLGVGGILIASMLYFLIFKGTLSVHELLITLFIFLTAPITALFMAKAHLHTQPDAAARLPRPESSTWGTCEAEELPRKQP